MRFTISIQKYILIPTVGTLVLVKESNISLLCDLLCFLNWSFLNVHTGKWEKNATFNVSPSPLSCRLLLGRSELPSKCLILQLHSFPPLTLIEWPKTHHKASLEIINTLPMLLWVRQSYGDNSHRDHSLIVMREGERESEGEKCGLPDLFRVRRDCTSTSLTLWSHAEKRTFLPLFSKKCMCKQQRRLHKHKIINICTYAASMPNITTS